MKVVNCGIFKKSPLGDLGVKLSVPTSLTALIQQVILYCASNTHSKNTILSPGNQAYHEMGELSLASPQ
jgi:hypothetical protein